MTQVAMFLILVAGISGWFFATWLMSRTEWGHKHHWRSGDLFLVTFFGTGLVAILAFVLWSIAGAIVGKGVGS